MADYNVNMKQWNGTSFDNVLPLAYNAKRLEGQSLAEVKQWVQDNNLLLYTGQYTGTGTYGVNNPTTLTFPFEPLFIIGITFKNYGGGLSSCILNMAVAETTYRQAYWFDNDRLQYLSMSNDRKTVKFYSERSIYAQYNESDKTYYFAAIGGHDMGGGN